MGKYGSKKQIKIASVVLGTPDSPPRILAEMYCKKNGKQAFSSLVRELIVAHLSDKPEFKDWKIQKLIFERKQIMESNLENGKKLCENTEQLEAFGVDVFHSNLNSDDTNIKKIKKT